MIRCNKLNCCIMLQVPFNKKSGYFYITNNGSIKSDRFFSQVEGVQYAVTLYKGKKLCHNCTLLLLEKILRIEIPVCIREHCEPIEDFEDRKKGVETFISETLSDFKMLRIFNGSLSFKY